MKQIKRILSLLLVVSLLLAGCTKTEPVTQSDEPKVEVDTQEDVDTTDKTVSDEATVHEDLDKVLYEPQAVPATILDDAIAYAIFPIAYADSDGNGTGDLQGIIDRLDYLKEDLHVDIIWLNPVHPSPSYHKYDVTDYYGIDPMFGSLEDYQTLLQEAHDRGMKVLLDYVINHTSSQHPWFLNAKTGPDAEYRDFYIWSDFEDAEYKDTSAWYSVSGSDEKYYAGFWSEMPDLNYDNPEVRAEIKNIAKYWLDMGVDGFRIDAASHIYDLNEYPKGTPVLTENHDWFIEFNDYIKSVNPDAFLLLEAWESYSTVSGFLAGADSAFNFDMSSAILSAVNSGNRKEAEGKLLKIHDKYDKVTTDYMDSIFLTNHDQDRLVNQVGGSIDKAKLAATIEMTMPGLSWIYYGEEIAMVGTGDHENIREGFKWTEDQNTLPNSRWRTWNFTKEVIPLDVQMADETSVFNHYKALTALKSSDPVIHYGSYIDYKIGSSFRILAFFRQYEGETYLVMHNLDDEGHNFELSEAVLSTVFASNGSQALDKTVLLSPYGSLVMAVGSEAVTAEELE